MKLSDFAYNLPKELIAQYPLKERDNARLLVLKRKDGSIEHRLFKDIADYLKNGDLFVLNDTKVLPSRLKGFRSTGARVEVLLLNRKKNLTFTALIKPSRLKLHEKIIFDGGSIFATIDAKNEISFEAKDVQSVYSLGVMPLPPYIKRDAEDPDNIYYQTVYAKEEGAVAAPTAGLHFTESLLEKMEAQGINFTYLTLHVGHGTFKPVKVEDITQHKMDSEYFKIPEGTISAVKKAKADFRRIIAVGTTSLRALETYASSGKKEGYTDLFIYPAYNFRITDCLLTNFHLPHTTLFMLVCAFYAAGASAADGGAGASVGAGIELIKRAYQEAIDKKYRFYSYGDAMLIV